MKTHFQPYYFAIFYSLLLIEMAIALFLKDGFIRHTFGDFLVVILIYCFIKSFFKTESYIVAIIVLCIAFTVEYLQLYNILKIFSLQDHKLARVVFGTSFSYQDLIAYTLGVLFAFFTDKIITRKHIKNEYN